MSSINIANLQGFFRPASQGGYDIDGNGSLDRPELAKASLNLLGTDNQDAQAAGSLLGTFVQGGKDGTGLLPDFNGDKALSFQEVSQFAGTGQTISSANFQQTFGDAYVPGGGTGSIEGLQEIAEGNLPKFTTENPEGFSNALGSLGVAPEFLQGFAELLQVILGYLKGTA